MGCSTEELKALLSASARPDDVATLAFAGVIANRSLRPAPYNVPIIGLSEAELLALKNRYFLDAESNFPCEAAPLNTLERNDEFDDLLALLFEHQARDNDETRWLAHAVATASMAENHLWQDMGLPNRKFCPNC